MSENKSRLIRARLSSAAFHCSGEPIGPTSMPYVCLWSVTRYVCCHTGVNVSMPFYTVAFSHWHIDEPFNTAKTYQRQQNLSKYWDDLLLPFWHRFRIRTEVKVYITRIFWSHLSRAACRKFLLCAQLACTSTWRTCNRIANEIVTPTWSQELSNRR